MLNAPQITIEGRLAADPLLRFTPAGNPVANMVVVANQRVQKGGEWSDGLAQFYEISLWKNDAEVCAEIFHKGDQVLVAGDLTARTYEDQSGQTQTRLGIFVRSIGPTLHTLAKRSGIGGKPRATGTTSDPWAEAIPADEPPF